MTITTKTIARKFLGKTSEIRMFFSGNAALIAVPTDWSSDFAEKAAAVASSTDFDGLHAACCGIDDFDAELYSAAHSLLTLTA